MPFLPSCHSLSNESMARYQHMQQRKRLALLFHYKSTGAGKGRGSLQEKKLLLLPDHPDQYINLGHLLHHERQADSWCGCWCAYRQSGGIPTGQVSVHTLRRRCCMPTHGWCGRIPCQGLHLLRSTCLLCCVHHDRPQGIHQPHHSEGPGQQLQAAHLRGGPSGCAVLCCGAPSLRSSACISDDESCAVTVCFGACLLRSSAGVSDDASQQIARQQAHAQQVVRSAW